MFLPGVKPLLVVAAVALAAPMTCFPAAISANGTCELNCGSPTTLGPGESITSTNFSFMYTFADTDKFLVAGAYSASGTTPTMRFQATATYLGNATNTGSGADTLSVDLIQNFSYNDDPDGTYFETATLSQSDISPGSYVTSELSFDGQGIGLLGPYTGTGSQVFTQSATLTGLTNPSLADFNYTFFAAAGTQAVPEPANIALVGIGLGGVAIARRRRASDHIVR